MDFVMSIEEALDELITLNSTDYDHWYNILYLQDDDETIGSIVENFNEQNNKRIWQCVADNLPTLYLAGCYND
jgi:hypothetical protein